MHELEHNISFFRIHILYQRGMIKMYWNYAGVEIIHIQSSVIYLKIPVESSRE